MTVITRATSIRAVIIDDTADLRALLRIALVDDGMTVVGEAGDGLTGIEAVRAEQPDLVLLDLSMPVMDGMTALPQIRAASPASKIIVLSGFGASQVAQLALAAGADAYLQKGITLDRILSRIREVLAGDSDDAHPTGSTTPRPVAAPRSPLSERVDRQTPGNEAIALAPYGVIEVEPAPPHRLVSVNPYARDLLPRATQCGVPLNAVAPGLAEMLSHPGQTNFEVRLGDRPGRVTVRRTPRSLYLFFEASADEVGLLRTAIATTAHEIRGPVAVLCALAETIADAAEVPISEEYQARLIASIARQARMLDGITSDLLTTAQIQRGTLRVNLETVDPQVVVGAAISDRHLDLSVRVEVRDTRRITADPLRLEQMLGNLLSNAVKYGRAPVVVRIRAAEQDDRVSIDVEDAGPGVPEDFRDQLFGEFSRASDTVAAGTGLGLHVVHTLAQAQNGSVSYRPGPVRGSVFTVTLPVAGP